ncbi:MAG: CHAT domain-containing protein [Wenzhouxiangellaceae bacterium]
MLEDDGVESYIKVTADDKEYTRYSAAWQSRKGRYYEVVEPGERMSVELGRFITQAPSGSVNIHVLEFDPVKPGHVAKLELYRLMAKSANLHLNGFFGREPMLEEAMEPLFEVLSRAMDNGEPLLWADASFEMGYLLYEQSRLIDAADYFNQSANEYQRLKDLSGYASALNMEALSLLDQGRTRAALSLFEQALEQRRNNGEGFHVGVTLSNIGLVYRKWGDYQKQAEILSGALEAFLCQEDISVEILLRNREYTIERLTTCGDAVEALTALHNLADALKDLGANQEARGYYRVILFYEDLDNRPGQIIKAKQNLAMLELKLGNIDESFELLSDALVNIENTGEKGWHGLILGNVGNVLDILGDHEAAIEYFDAALSVIPDQSKREIGIQLYNKGKSLLDLSMLDQAKAVYAQLYEIVDYSDDPVFYAGLEKDYGRYQVLISDYERAHESFDHSLSIYRELGNTRMYGQALAEKGRAYYEQGAWKKAQDVLEKALQIHRDMFDYERELQTLKVLVELFGRQSEHRMVEQYAEEAIDKARTISRQGISPSRKVQYLNHLHDIYEKYLDSQLAEKGYAQAWRLSESLRSRDLVYMLESRYMPEKDIEVEQLLNKQSELLGKLSILNARLDNSSVSPPAKDLMSEVSRLKVELSVTRSRLDALRVVDAIGLTSDSVGLLSFQQMLGTEDLVLNYFLGDERSYVWIIGNNSVSFKVLPSRAVINEKVEYLANWVRDSSTAPGMTIAAASDIADVLLPPLDDYQDKSRLIVIPDGSIHLLPFNTLFFSSQGTQKPLVSEYEIVYLNSAKLLNILREREKPDVNGIVVIADPEFASGKLDGSLQLAHNSLRSPYAGEVNGLSRLPGTMLEAEAIKKQSTDELVKLITRGSASYDFVKANGLSGHRIIHFATHGLMHSKMSSLSGLVLANTEDGQLSLLKPDEIASLDLQANLVVLSSCDSGVGVSIQGEGPMSLARPFFIAGADQVIASLWKVSDLATAELMDAFYHYLLQEKLPASAALRKAQNHMRESEHWQHPYYWAGFVLHGDWASAGQDRQQD